jgi:hypothetical protein
MLRKSLGSKRSGYTFSSRSVPKPIMILGVDHEETFEAHSNNTSMKLITGHKSSIPSTIDLIF